MKKILLIISGLLLVSALYAQQLPISESYFVDNYSLSSAYAGNSQNKNLFASYRRDWYGIDQTPQTIRLSYHDGFKSRAGLGGKLILDKFGIFQSLYGLATYSYRLQVVADHSIYFGLSAGIHQNMLNFADYYNDPNFTADISLISKDVKSEVKLISDFSMIYAFKRFHAGVLFSNISYSEYTYRYVKTTYNPFFHYQVHAMYNIPFQDSWQLVPIVIYRGEKGVQDQLEVASQIKYNGKVWGSIGHRGKSIYSLGFGLNAGKGLMFNYNFNFFSGFGLNRFQHHELTVGLRLSEFFPKKGETGSDKEMSAIAPGL